MVGKTYKEQESDCPQDVIDYTYGSASVAGTPIYVAGIGAMIPQASKDASVLNSYLVRGRIKACVTNSIAITVGAPVFYNTATDKVVLAAPAAGFYLGVALAAATGDSAGTVYVSVNLNANPETIDKNWSSIDTADTAPTLTAAQVYGGVILATILSPRTITFCSAADLWAVVPGARVGASVVVTFVNNGADTDAVTVAVPASITNKGLSGHLTVSQNTARTYRLIFTSATAADLIPMN